MFKKFEPYDRLKDYILFYFEIDWKKSVSGDIIKYLCIPTGCSFMGFQKKGRMKVQMDDSIYNTEKYYVNAQTTVPYFMCSDDPCLNVMVACLKPTALFHLFNLDVSKIVNTGVNPKNLLKGFDLSKEALLMHSTAKENVDMLDKLFLNQLETVTSVPNFIDRAIQLILESQGTITIQELVDKIRVSKRYFQKKFKEIVGIQPSLYIKIIRYNFIFATFNEDDINDCKSTTALFNFYDSAHYSNSFKRYLGLPPSEFNPDDFPFVKLTSIEQAVWINAFRSLSA